jgi:hypothetical protein
MPCAAKNELMCRTAKPNGVAGILIQLVLALIVVFVCLEGMAITVSNRYRSPRNPERSIRNSTTLIVLHTTEAPAKSSINKVSDRGECHYVVTESGDVYAIVDRDKEAFHAGRSMWKGKEDVDKFSVGIECVGYHDKPMGMVQLRALAALIEDLQARYKISDENVVCHSHVAYGAPNKWHKKRHRGRKQCAMLFGTPTVRNILSLKSRPSVDQDVKAKRLVVGDAYLQSVLYGNADPMRRHYKNASGVKDRPKVVYKSVKPKSTASKTVQKNVSQKANSAQKQMPPQKKPSPGKIKPKSIQELVKNGWKIRGVISGKATASSIMGNAWNKPDVFYTIRNTIISGAEINSAKIENGTMIWVKE